LPSGSGDRLVAVRRRKTGLPSVVASRPARDSVVCQLVHGLPIGGAEVLVDRMVRRLRHERPCIIACLDQVGELGERLSRDGIRVVNLQRRPGFDWRCVRRLSRLVADEQVRVIHAHQYTPFAYALATRVFCRRPPVLFTEHGRFHPDYPSWKRKWFNRLLSDRHDRFVAVGDAVRQALIDKEGLPPARVEVVYNGVDLPCADGDSHTRAEVRHELKVADDECLVVQVARLDTIKDHKTAIRAVALALRQAPRVRLLIVGDGPEQAAIEREIADHSLHAQVTMLGLRRDVPRLLAAADVFLLTSLSEGIPVTIIEAMAAGVPVVSTAVGGVPELIEDGVTGLLAPAGDAPRLADALVRLATDPHARATLAEQAKSRASKEFSEQTMIDHYDRIYGEMLARRENVA
jgi:L-malate glycosyltransferase